jgi:hypothetical protein
MIGVSRREGERETTTTLGDLLDMPSSDANRLGSK